MVNSKVDAFLEEFPFTKQVIGSKTITDVKVRLLEESVMNARGRYWLVTDEKEAQSGMAEIVTRVGYTDPPGSLLTRWMHPSRWFNEFETVFRAYRRLPSETAKRVRYVLQLRYISRDIFEPDCWGLVVHRIPRKFATMDALYEHFVAEQKKEICGEVSQIDSE